MKPIDPGDGSGIRLKPGGPHYPTPNRRHDPRPFPEWPPSGGGK